MNNETSTQAETGEKAQSPPKKTTIVSACSGCSDAGEIADRIARRLTREGAAQMSCLAGIGGRVKSLVLKAENAERILVVDGCPLNCAAHTLKLAGFAKFDHLELHKIGIRKGSCPVTDERVTAGVDAAKKIISRSEDANTAPVDTRSLSPEVHRPLEAKSQNTDD
ncbi:MAG TPA: putative zinc-binding protein [Verrucomicrobiae bacterium]|nr:putative zinc-binding protein [Verrucomicrobiae bacterium]